MSDLEQLVLRKWAEITKLTGSREFSLQYNYLIQCWEPMILTTLDISLIVESLLKASVV